MKQHITEKQLDKLSDKAKDKLRDWWKPERGDKCLCWPRETFLVRETFIGNLNDDYEEDTIDAVENKDSLPLLSIGQMIGFLDEIDQVNYVTGERYGKRIWIVDTVWGKEYIENELCDALWEAVKEILENKL